MGVYGIAISCRPAEAGRDDDEIVDALYEAGCDDALVVKRGGAFVIEFDREAANYAAAAESALRAVRAAGMTPLGVEPDPLDRPIDDAGRPGVARRA